jgi:two-component system, cell cycle sensor histidine kinase and response regulator CckA
MKLSYKAWALVFLTVGLFSLLAVLGARWIMAASFSELENQAAFAEGERANRLVNQQLRGLGAQVRSAAYSADMVSYAAGARPNELGNLFDVTKMSDLGLSGVVVFDKNARYVGSVADSQTGWTEPVDADLIDKLRPLTASVFGDSNGGATLQTLLRWNEKLYLVAVAAVLDPALSNAPNGAMVMIRHFSAAEVQSLANVLLRPVSLTLEPPPLSALHTRLQVIDDQNIDLFTPLSNSEGVYVAQLILRLDRPLRIGQQQLSQAGLVLAGVAGLLASLLLSVLLYRLVLRRMLNLHEDLKAVIEQGPTVGGTVRVQGNDELSRLAQRTNQLLERVRQDAVLQQEAHERQDALQGQLMQAQKSEALQKFTSGIAHDFNNSLAAVAGWQKLAAEDLAPDHPSFEAVQHAQKAARYATELMRQLSAYSRQTPRNLQRVSLADLLESARSLFDPGRVQRSSLHMECRADMTWVNADPTQIQQVLVNLLINASDAMDGKGTIRVTLDTVELPAATSANIGKEAANLPKGLYVQLRVQDEGSGIAPEHLGRLFDPYFTTKPVGRGSGLGLSVAQGIVVGHGGAIGVTSTPGEGACFNVLLPACLQPLGTTDLQVGKNKGPDSCRLLFVEDEALVRDAWCKLLKKAGWEVTCAKDGEEAWAAFEQDAGSWDVVLTDLTMPNMTGMELAQKIVSRSKPPPVVLMSGHVGTLDSTGGNLSMFAAVLHKPVDPEELHRVLLDVLTRRREKVFEA